MDPRSDSVGPLVRRGLASSFRPSNPGSGLEPAGPRQPRGRAAREILTEAALSLDGAKMS